MQNPLVRNTDPDTSHIAAAKISVSKDCLVALSYFKEMLKDLNVHDITRLEFEEYFGPRLGTRRAYSLRRRLGDLVKDGRLVDIGKRKASRLLRLP